MRLWTLSASIVRDVHRQFSDLAKQRVKNPRTVTPTQAELRQLIESAFWASLLPNEGRYVPFSVLFVPPAACKATITFQPRVVAPKVLRDLAPIVPANATLCARRGQHGLEIWGISLDRPAFPLVRTTRPGRVVVQIGHEVLVLLDGGRALTVLRQDRQPHGLGRPHCAGFISSCLTRTPRSRSHVTGAVLLMLVEAMREHGNGGTMLVVRRPSKRLSRELAVSLPARASIGARNVRNFLLKGIPPSLGGPEAFERVPALKKYLLHGLPRGRALDTGFLAITEAIGRLTAIDGAVVLNSDLDLLGAGAIILSRPRPGESVFRGSILSPKEVERIRIGPDLGGTRAQSAARFVAHNRGAMALVASHDGSLTLCAWIDGLAGIEGRQPTLYQHLEALVE